MINLPAQNAFDGVAVRLPANSRFETLPCRQALGEVLFVPGLFSEQPNMLSVYGEGLKAVFPNYTITVLKWETVTPKSTDDLSEVWPEAKRKAEAMAKALAVHMMTLPPAVQRRVIMVGHSIGCQLVAQAAYLLGTRGMKIRRLILLGAALPYDIEGLDELGGMSLEAPLNIFNPNDFVLRYCYHNVEGLPALGLLGYKTKLRRWLEYSRFPEEQNIRDTRSQTFWSKMGAHDTDDYLEVLREVLTGRLTPAFKIDHAAITFPQTFLSLPPSVSIPRLPQMQLHKTYFGWVYGSLKIPELELPLFGKINHIYLLLNPFGQCCGWHVFRSPIEERFDTVRYIIDQQLREARRRGEIR